MDTNLILAENLRNHQALSVFKACSYEPRDAGVFSWRRLLYKIRRRRAEKYLLPLLHRAVPDAIKIHTHDPLCVYLFYCCVQRAHNDIFRPGSYSGICSWEELYLAGRLLSESVLKQRFPGIEFDITDFQKERDVTLPEPPTIGIATPIL